MRDGAYDALSRELERLAGQTPEDSMGVGTSVGLPGGGEIFVELTGPGFREEALALARALGHDAEADAYRRGWRDCAALALAEARDMVGAIEKLGERGRK